MPLHRINAIISNGNQIVAQQALETCFRVTSRGVKGKGTSINATRTGAVLDSARSSEYQFQGMVYYYSPTLPLLILTMHSHCWNSLGACGHQ
jgi:hypothetical protein